MLKSRFQKTRNILTNCLLSTCYLFILSAIAVSPNPTQIVIQHFSVTSDNALNASLKLNTTKTPDNLLMNPKAYFHYINDPLPKQIKLVPTGTSSYLEAIQKHTSNGHASEQFGSRISKTLRHYIDTKFMQNSTRVEVPMSISKMESVDLKRQEVLAETKFQKGIQVILKAIKNISKYAEEAWKVMVLLVLIAMPFVAIGVTIPMVAVVFASVYLPDIDLSELK